MKTAMVAVSLLILTFGVGYAHTDLTTAQVKAILDAASPSPFSSTTRIAYSVPSGRGPTHVMLSIYDSLGRLVAKPVLG